MKHTPSHTITESSNRRRQQGFTIIELLIATSVFAIVLLIVTVAVLFISQTYIEGNNEANTQDVARNILTSIAQDIEFNDPSAVVIPPSTGSPAPNYDSYYCIGSHLYLYQTSIEINTSSSPPRHGLLFEDTTTCPVSRGTAPLGDLETNTAGEQELLTQHMSLGQLNITSSATGVYTITISVGYGPSDLLTPIGVTAAGTNGVSYRCKPESFGDQFCAVSTLTTTVDARIIN